MAYRSSSLEGRARTHQSLELRTLPELFRLEAPGARRFVLLSVAKPPDKELPRVSLMNKQSLLRRERV